jgi:transcriptional regulator with XRE-family HTH domain
MEVTMNRIAPRPRPVVAFSPLTQALRRYRSRVQKSQADISRDCWLNESYVSRLFSGERNNPSRDALILLSVYGLDLALEDTEEVLIAADYKPLVLPQTLR